MTTVDTTGKMVKISEDGMIRVDGITVFRRVERDGILYVQFKDYDRMRSKCRGTYLVEIPLNILVEMIKPDEAAT